jgi:hypothetical protein
MRAQPPRPTWARAVRSISTSDIGFLSKPARPGRALKSHILPRDIDVEPRSASVSLICIERFIYALPLLVDLHATCRTRPYLALHVGQVINLRYMQGIGCLHLSVKKLIFPIDARWTNQNSLYEDDRFGERLRAH